MTEYLKVKSDVSLVRDMDSNAIVNQNQSEYDKFMSLSKKKYKEQNELDTICDILKDFFSLNNNESLFSES